MIDRLVAPIESNRVVGTGPNDSFDTADPCGLINIAHADDVGIENIFPNTFTRVASEMQDTVDTINSGAHGIQVLKVSLHKPLTLPKSGNGRAIGQTQLIFPTQLRAQITPDTTSCAGHQNRLHI